MKQIVTAIALIMSISLMAQSNANSVADLNDTEVPGSLIIDFGINFVGDDSSDSLNFEPFGSKAFRIGYQYEIPLGKSAFTFNPGIAFSVEKYKFKDNYVLQQNIDKTISLDSVDFELTKSQIAMNYLEVPIELRWHLDKSEIQRSFRIAIGAKFGMRAGGKTKLKFDDPDTGITRVVKDKQNYELTRWRVGVYGKVSVGAFGLYYYQSLTELFEDNKGPGATTATPFQIGLSYEIF